MEENQITCPQCGLVNNVLADACVQCGIIFVKDPAMMATATVQDDEKRKSIEAAEAILDETQAFAGPDAPANETIKRPDPHEDTVQIRIPQPEESSSSEVELSDSNTPESKAQEEAPNAEIELEAIEAAMEAVGESTDVETLFLSDVKVDESPEPAATKNSEEPVGTTGDDQNTADTPADAAEPVSVKEDSPDSKADDKQTDQPETEPVAADPSPENELKLELEKDQSEPAAPAETETKAQKPVESVKTGEEDAAKLQDDGQVYDEIQLELESEVTPGEKDAVPTKAQNDTPALNKTTPKAAENDAKAHQEEQKARNDALKKQQEALTEAEAHKKEEAAKTKAAELKKKKLTQAKAEALKKQKAAQARAEALKKKQARALALKKQKTSQVKADALKKQKTAQANAEASAGSIEVAAAGQHNHVKLLGLLKRYKGKAIGINYENSAEIKEAELVEANEEFFSVMVKEKKVQYSYPLNTILTIVEGEQGVETGEKNKKAKFDAVIKVYPLVF